jgi:hypothetical protein
MHGSWRISFHQKSLKLVLICWCLQWPRTLRAFSFWESYRKALYDEMGDPYTLIVLD